MQTALAGDDWRPGFAKRAPNFDAVCAQARAWRWQAGVTVARIAAAVLKGTPMLTVQQRMTLLLYVEHLNQDRLEQDVATVWPGIMSKQVNIANGALAPLLSSSMTTK